MSEFLKEEVLPHFNYWVYVILMMIGLFAMISKKNLIKKLIGMAIFQSAIILFYISVGVKEGAQIPIVHYGHGKDAEHSEETDHPQPPGEGYGVAEHAADDTKHAADDGHADSAAGAHKGYGKGGHAIDPRRYGNPLPHVLMLTAIVVGVATLGVGLAVVQVIYRDFGTIEENEILEQIKTSPDG